MPLMVWAPRSSLCLPISTTSLGAHVPGPCHCLRRYCHGAAKVYAEDG